MIPSKWEKLKSEFIADLTIFRARIDTLINPRNKKEIRVTVLESNDAVNVVAITAENKIVIVNQFRFGTQALSLELPGGFVEEGETALQAAKRELEEETGYLADSWEHLGKIDANPVFQNAGIHHFIAQNASKRSNTNFDDAEFVEVLEWSQEELKQALLQNKISHPHSLSALSRVYNIFSSPSI